nr:MULTISPECIES: GrpB family protein [unclassified Pedobacter]
MIIVKYQKTWPDDFNKISNVLIQALNGLNIAIEHIGSTAIINLAAKPIIDIDIVFGEEIEFEQIKSG